ncbi:MAG: STY0301 family protein [Bryobacteraceae bacterium]
MAGARRQSPAGKWIACRYGERGEVILAKRLGDSTSTCVVSSLHKKLEWATRNTHGCSCSEPARPQTYSTQGRVIGSVIRLVRAV